MWRPGSRAADPAPPWSASPSRRTPLSFRSVPQTFVIAQTYHQYRRFYWPEYTAEEEIHGNKGCSNIGLLQVRPAAVEVARCDGACTASQHLKHRYMLSLIHI